jgi:hypothetical protein
MSATDEFEFELDLLSNGIDFILRGIDEIYEEELLSDRDFATQLIEPKSMPARAYKYIVLHLFSGFLLILKHRLYIHNELAIYIGTIQDVKNKLRSGKKLPATIDYDEALGRLEMILNFTFSDDDLKVINRIREYRNTFEHYKASGNKYHLWDSIIRFLNIIETFLREQLHTNIEDLTEDTITIGKMQVIEQVWQRSLDKEKERQKLEIYNWKLEMQIILNRFVYLQSQGRISIKQNQFTDKYIDIDDDDDIDYDIEDPNLLECPSCCEVSLIIKGEFCGICANPECNEVYPITTCYICPNPVVGFRWEDSFCEECRSHMDHLMSKD